MWRPKYDTMRPVAGALRVKHALHLVDFMRAPRTSPLDAALFLDDSEDTIRYELHLRITVQSWDAANAADVVLAYALEARVQQRELDPLAPLPDEPYRDDDFILVNDDDDAAAAAEDAMNPVVSTMVFPLGRTFYSDPTAPFIFARAFGDPPAEALLYPDLVDADEQQQQQQPSPATPHSRENIIKRLSTLVKTLFRDSNTAGPEQHAEVLIGEVVRPFATEMARMLHDFYANQLARTVASLSPFTCQWKRKLTNFSRENRVATLDARHVTSALRGQSKVHAFLITVTTDDDLVPAASHSMLYAFAFEHEDARAHNTNTRIVPFGDMDDGDPARSIYVLTSPAHPLMAARGATFRGRSPTFRYTPRSWPRFRGAFEADWSMLESEIITPLLWHTVLRLKEAVGDTDFAALSDNLENVTATKRSTYVMNASLGSALNQSITEPPMALAVERTANVRWCRPFRDAVMAECPLRAVHSQILSLGSKKKTNSAAVAPAASLFELTAIDVRYAAVPARSSAADLVYRRPGNKRLVATIALAVRMRDPQVFTAMAPDQVLLELVAEAPAATPDKKWPDMDADHPEYATPANPTLVQVRKRDLRVNMLYDRDTGAAMSSQHPNNYFVAAFVVPIARKVADAAELSDYATVTVSMGETFWLDALLARMPPEALPYLAAIETRTYDYTLDMPRPDANFGLTEGERASLICPYYAGLVTSAINTPDFLAHVPSKKKRDAEPIKQQMADRLADMANAAAVEYMSLHGHAHTITSAPALRAWAMRWYSSARDIRHITADYYYYGAAAHTPSASIPIDDQRFEAAVNARLTALLFHPEAQHSLDIALLTRNGDMERCRVATQYPNFFPVPMTYDDYDAFLATMHV